MNTADKRHAYTVVLGTLEQELQNESDHIAKMATINCALKEHLQYYFWVGFYRVVNGALIVGPYQGTHGTIHIQFGKGVCGTAAVELTTQVVSDVHACKNHIVCDARSRSEIVVPVFDRSGELVAVFDADSEQVGAFDEVDKEYLEQLMHVCFSKH